MTNYGHPVACAAGLAAVKAYKKNNLINKSAHLGNIIEKRFNKLKRKFNCIGDIRGKGLFYAIEFVKDKNNKRLVNWTYKDYFKQSQEMKNLFKYLSSKGLYCYGRYNMLYICPPLIISKKELNDSLNIIEKGIFINIEQKFF